MKYIVASLQLLTLQIEYILVHFDPVKCTARLSLRGPEILDEFLHEEQEMSKAKYASLIISLMF